VDRARHLIGLDGKGAGTAGAGAESRGSGVTRRSLLAGGAAGAGALAFTRSPARAATAAGRALEPIIRDGAFAHGVGSGQPGRRSITLWTRVDGIERSGRLELEIARDPQFKSLVHRQRVRAASFRDFTVRQRVESRRLKAGEEYYYRFATGTQDSAVGRFVTARPPDSREPVRIGFFSCQDYQAGYYTALAGLAKEPDLDLIVCLGDYVYERTYYVGPPGRRDTLGANGDAEVQTLPEYRQKYRLYRTDADLQAIHSAAPFMAIWDDHEVEDDYAGDQPGEATGQVRVPFSQRRRNAYLAFFENMPMEVVRADPNRLYRTLRLGGLVDLLLLDTRQYRDDQPCGDQIGRPCPEDEAPGRTLLGQTQKAWLKGNLESSRAAWKVVANQVMIMSLDAVPGVALNHDQWDGYGAERRDLLRFVGDRAIKDVAFITGDIHTFFAGQVHPGGRQSTGPSVATEFVGGSVTSLGIGPTLGLSDQQAAPLVNNATALNPHLRYANFADRGYGVLEARPDELRVEFKSPQTTQQPTNPIRTLARFRVPRGTPRVERA